MHHRCPDEEMLAAWLDGLLSEEARDALSTEMSGCADCTQLLAALGQVGAAESPADLATTVVPAAVTRRAQALWPEEPALARAARLAVRWVHDRLAPLADALTPLATPALALRGGSTSGEAHEELHYQVRVGEVDLAIGLEVDGPEQIALTVRPLATPPAGLLLRLSTAGETCAMSSLTAHGALVPALLCGEYELSLERAGQSLGRLDLSFQA